MLGIFTVENPTLNDAITAGASQIADGLGKLELQLAEQNQIAAEQLKVSQRTYRLLRALFPLQGTITIKLESEDMDKLKYKVDFSGPSDPDTVKRVLKVAVGGVAQPDVEFPKGTTDLGHVVVDQDASVHLGVVDVDDAGNASNEIGTDFVATDTLAPHLDGAFGVTLVGEEEDVPVTTTQPPEVTTPAPEVPPAE